MKPVIAALMSSVALVLAGCAAGTPEAPGTASSVEETSTREARATAGPATGLDGPPGAISIRGVSPFLPLPGDAGEKTLPAPGAAERKWPSNGGAMEYLGAVTMCQDWTVLLNALGGPQEAVDAASAKVAMAQSGAGPAELKRASRIMMQRIAGPSGKVRAGTGQAPYILSYARLADACRAAGAPLVPDTSLS